MQQRSRVVAGPKGRVRELRLEIRAVKRRGKQLTGKSWQRKEEEEGRSGSSRTGIPKGHYVK